MSIQAVAWALEQDLPARPKLVLVSIANHANHTDGYCWLKAETIAGEAACTSRSVYRFIGGLVRNGYLRKAPRKGEDGKQRANDYWIIFNREPADWDWGAGLDEDGVDPIADDDAVEDATTTTSSNVADLPQEPISHGEGTSPTVSEPVDMHAVSHGPYDSGVSRKRIDEPSKTNPKGPALGAAASAGMRGYRPPPPQPIGAVVEGAKQQIFVFEGSKAWKAWIDHIRRTEGRSWSLTSRACIDGQWRTGWWWPSLFPPAGQPSAGTGPPHHAA